MAASLNKVLIMGNLTRDPELRYVPSGAAVANFTVAVNRTYKDKAGERKEDASFIRVVVWGKMAEICGEYLAKGRSVLVEGRLQSRSWEGQDGQKKNTLEVIAASVQFLGTRGNKPEDASDGKTRDVGSVDLDMENGSNAGARETIDESEVPF
ncbi:MAG: single-stranded DNA-binding protein [Candidatus Omnitrophica bacterium]|nr:single-stranded DNA-binding protein [Candidatus Omnitrophota bacterium]MBU1784258.1 single-stranded DNA-binding protein [Candidatus Omnitrophota bacterium]MBU1851281.1 single-stranded DNA-binding protein [Candidatus Omnitrophota bacterium]